MLSTSFYNHLRITKTSTLPWHHSVQHRGECVWKGGWVENGIGTFGRDGGEKCGGAPRQWSFNGNDRKTQTGSQSSRRHRQMDVTIYILETGRDSLDPVCLKVWDLRNQRFAVPLHCEWPEGQCIYIQLGHQSLWTTRLLGGCFQAVAPHGEWKRSRQQLYIQRCHWHLWQSANVAHGVVLGQRDDHPTDSVRHDNWQHLGWKFGTLAELWKG